MASAIQQIFLFFFLNVLTREELKTIQTLIWSSNSYCFGSRILIFNSLIILLSGFLGPIEKYVQFF